MDAHGEYPLLREIGCGASGRVFLSEDPATKEKVCLKIFHPRMFHDAHTRERMQREIHISSQLKHPNIVAVRGVVNGQESPALVMDFVDGESLERFQTRLPYIFPEISARILVEVLEGLAHAHAAGIIHRDIKPENILISKDGRIYISDFGLAKVKNSTLATQTNVLVGSPDYMSPEQTQGEVLTPSSDLFSAASVFYFMVTGTRPFSREGVMATVSAIKNENPESPSKRNPKISSELSRIILKGLEKDPRKRFASASEFRDALVQYLTRLDLYQPAFSLQEWLRNPSFVTMDGLRTVSEALIRQAEKDLQTKNWDHFLECISHLSLKAPQSLELGRLMTQYEEAKKKRKLGFYIWSSTGTVVLLFLAVLGWTYEGSAPWLPKTAVHIGSLPEKLEIPPVVETVEPVKTAEASSPPIEAAPKLPVVTKPVVSKPRPPTASKVARMGKVKFEVAEGIDVYWDGKKVSNTAEFSDELGKHFLLLQREGYEAIRSTIMVKAEEPTLIKVR